MWIRIGYSTLILDDDESAESPSSAVERPAISSRAVSTHRRKGDVTTRWIGNSSLARRFLPVSSASRRPSSDKGASHGLGTVVHHDRSTPGPMSLRWPWRMTRTCWNWSGTTVDAIAAGEFEVERLCADGAEKKMKRRRGRVCEKESKRFLEARVESTPLLKLVNLLQPVLLRALEIRVAQIKREDTHCFSLSHSLP